MTLWWVMSYLSTSTISSCGWSANIFMTGESKMVNKDSNKDPFVFSGCKVADGNGVMLMFLEANHYQIISFDSAISSSFRIVENNTIDRFVIDEEDIKIFRFSFFFLSGW